MFIGKMAGHSYKSMEKSAIDGIDSGMSAAVMSWKSFFKGNYFLTRASLFSDNGCSMLELDNLTKSGIKTALRHNEGRI